MELRELSLRFDRQALEALLADAGIHLESTLTYCCGLYEGRTLVACGGYEGSTIKCLAVSPGWQGYALLNTICSHLYTRLRNEGAREIFVFTRPENQALFRSLGFSALAKTEEAVLLTNDPREIEAYIRALHNRASECRPPGEEECAGQISAGQAPPVGAIVLNANPFTLGHRRLVELAAARCSRLYLFVVEEDRSVFPFVVRLRLVREGTADIKNVIVAAGGPYIISSATFPSYFLKDPEGAASVHAALDVTLFAERIAPPLGITHRFAGEEPLDPLTRLYNETMQRILPSHGLEFTIFPRACHGDIPISASAVRRLLSEGNMEEANALLPGSTRAFLLEEEGRTLIARLQREALHAD